MPKAPVSIRSSLYRLLALAFALLLNACGSLPGRQALPPPTGYVTFREAGHAEDVVLASISLVDTGYRFGGSNPEAGLDCSGMVSHVFAQAADLKLPHSAARIAELTRPVARDQMQPGDLVFFEADRRPWSHVGIYIGDGRFIHAPSSRGKVRISRLDQGWYADHFQAGRTLAKP